MQGAEVQRTGSALRVTRGTFVRRLPSWGLREEKEPRMPIDNDALVYSTDHGDLRKRRPAAPPAPILPPSQQTALIQRTSKGHGGKVVTLVKNLHLSPD